MKLRSVALGLLLMISSSAVFAATANHSLSISDVIKRLEAAGYTTIKEVEYEHGVYEAEVFDKQGHKIKLHINSQTGAILDPRAANANAMTAKQAIVAIEKAGYKNIRKIENEHGYFKAKAFDAKGNKVKLKVDPATGAVSVRDDD